MINKIILLITDHDKLNYQFLKKNSKVIFDCRGRYKNNFDKKIIQV